MWWASLRHCPTYLHLILTFKSNVSKYFSAENRQTTTNVDLARPFGNLNAIPTIVLDLIRHGGGSIKLLCVDFNLGAWGSGYEPSHSKLIDKRRIFGQHPAPLQFLMVKSLSRYFDVSLAKNPHIHLSRNYRYFVRKFSQRSVSFGAFSWSMLWKRILIFFGSIKVFRTKLSYQSVMPGFSFVFF